MKRRVLAILLFLCLAMGLFPVAALAAEKTGGAGAPLDIRGESVEIEESGSFAVIQTGTGETKNTITVKSGVAADVTITGLNIRAEDHPAILVEAGATLNLTVTGENTLAGGDGFAAICVAPAYDGEGNYDPSTSAALTIDGTGKLYAAGGKGGAGLGGNAFDKDNPDADHVDFGTITVSEDFEGEIRALGGEDAPDRGEGTGGGAGIGSGGYNDSTYYWGPTVGTITIGGGTVNATSNGSGAGIGSGSGEGFDSSTSNIEIAIHGGMVMATGGTLGAGIGSGSCADGGYIDIDGGVVTAIGGSADGSMGAAGIGGGSDASVHEVTITGGTVTATASGGAAGIGGGTNTSYGFQYGDVNGVRDHAGKISISGEDTVVTATGGTGVGSSGTFGGAGIGAGYPVGNNGRSVAFDISITDGPTVVAYGGYHAQAIGYGYRPNGDAYYTGYGVHLELDDSIALWARNLDCFQPALAAKTDYDQSPVQYESENGTKLIWSTAETVDAENTASGVASYGESLGGTVETKAWTLQGGELMVDSTVLQSGLVETTLGNWATLLAAPVPQHTVSYDLRGGTGADGVSYDPETVKSGTIVTAKAAPGKSGEIFLGWAENTGHLYQPGDPITVLSDIILTAQWKGKPSGTTRYPLHYESNGGTEYGDERYAAGTNVSLDKVPTRDGYVFTGWYADEELTEQITSIKMTSSKTVYAGWRAAAVPGMLNGEDHFAYVIGYPDGMVRPNASISRAETATIFFRLLKAEVRDGSLTSSSAFADMTEGMWCNTAISTMAELGIVKGRGSDAFAPNAPITRAEFAAICARFDTGLTEGDSDFTDIAGHWAQAEIARAVSLGWIRGYEDGTFRPDQFITRAEAMTIINRVLCRIPAEEGDLLAGMNTWPDNQPGAWHYLAVQEATNSHDFKRKGEIHEHWTGLTADPDWTRYEN